MSEGLDQVGKNIKLERIVPDLSIFKELPRDYGNSLMAYARLALPWMLSTEIKRLLYFDSDIVFLREWSALWNVDLGKSLVAAAVCPVVQTLQRENLPLNELGLPPDAPYLQSGIMVMDLDRWRDQQISEHAVKYLTRFPSNARYWDQSALNAVLLGQWLEIAEEWNMAAFRYRELTSGQKGSVGVIHYTGPQKPWHFNKSKDECNAFFFQQLENTVWKKWRPSRIRSHLRFLKYIADQFCEKIGTLRRF